MKVILEKGMKLLFDNEEEYRTALEVVEEELVHENPNKRSYANAQRFPKNFVDKTYSYSKSDYSRRITIPRGSGDTLRRIMMKANIHLKKGDIQDNTCKGHKISIKHKFNPRDELQVQAINSFVSNNKRHLILNCSCGFGKSYCALKIAEKLSISTLLLVDENLLLDQWIENIENDCIFDLSKLGIVGKGKEEYVNKDVIIASKDTLINRPEIINYLNKHIGFVVVDEAHVASADIFQSVLKELNPYRVLGLTATPKRSDGLSYLMHEQIGPICFKAEREKLLKLGSIMNPELRVFYVNRGEYFKEKLDEYRTKKKSELLAIKPDKDNKYKIGNRKYTKKYWEKKVKETQFLDYDWQFLSNTVENDIKTIQTISKIIKHHYDVGDQSICICRKIEFAKKYLETLKSMGVKENEIALILGETKSSERMELIERAKNKELKIIITSSILDKGISIDSANVLFLLYPSKNENSTEQRIGRVSRTQKGKTYAYVYDFIYDHGMFFAQFYKSQRIEYKECRWNVESYCTNYNRDKVKNFIDKMTDKFWCSLNVPLEVLDINNLSNETLKNAETIII